MGNGERQSSDQVIRPTVTKTFFKGLIAIGVFSLFLEVNPSNIVNYFIFLAISIGLVLAYMGAKRSVKYTISATTLSIAALFRAEKIIPYTEIEGLTVSQGILAKRFHCGSIYIQLGGARKGSFISFTGGMAESLRDVKNPSEIYDRIASALNPNSMF
jgi:membrane protein YdbS with pleckstrin-like domain